MLDRLRAAGVDAPVVVGGIIPDERRRGAARGKGVAAVYTPKDFSFARIMDELVSMVAAARGTQGCAARAW